MTRKKLKFQHGFDEFLNHIKAKRRPATYDFYEQYLRFLEKYFEDLNIYKISRKDIDKFINEKRKNSPSIRNAGINKYLTVLKVYYRFFTGEKLHYTKLTEEHEQKDILKPETIRKVYEYYEDNLDDKCLFRNYIYFKLLQDTGLRRNELLHIKAENIDLDHNTLLATVTKRNGYRYVPFRRKTALLLKKYMVACVRSGYLFIDFETGMQLTNSAIASLCVRLKKKLNLDESITPTKWRRYFATTFAKSGGDLEALRRMMGHSKLTTTQKYLNYTRQDIIDCYTNIYTD